MINNQPQDETMPEHYLLGFNDIVVCRLSDIPPLNRKFGNSDFSC